MEEAWIRLQRDEDGVIRARLVDRGGHSSYRVTVLADDLAQAFNEGGLPEMVRRAREALARNR